MGEYDVVLAALGSYVYSSIKRVGRPFYLQQIHTYYSNSGH